MRNMKSVHLAFKAFDCHELLCHAVALRAGLYEQKDLAVTLLDSTFIPDQELPENTYSVACGAALAGFLQGGNQRVVFVACDRPMFWVYGRPSLGQLTDLDNARIATFPEAAPPAGLLRKLLADADVSPHLLPCRDDVARLGMLRMGSVDAALLSSLFLPCQVESNELRRLAFVGEMLRLPSTGLAVPGNLFDAAPEQVEDMTGVFQKAMRLVFSEDDLLCEVLRKTFSVPRECLRQAAETVRSCYNPAGHCDAGFVQAAVDNMATALGVESRPATGLYDFRYLEKTD